MIELAGTRPGLGLVVAVTTGAVLAVAIASALDPTATLFAVIVATAVVVLRRWPVALVASYAVVEPLQALLTRPLPPAARYLDEAVVVGLFLVVVVPALARRPGRLLRDPVLLLALAFVVEGLVSARVNDVPADVALAGLFVTLDYLLLFFVLREMSLGTREVKALVYTLAVLGVLATVVAALQHLFPGLVASWQLDIREGSVARVPSLFRHPNAFGYFMLAATFVTLSAAFTTRRVGLGVVAGICALGIFLSVSRSSYLALFVALGVGGVMANRRLLKVWLALALLATTLLGPLFIGGIEARLAKIKREGGDARWTYLVKSIPIVRDHPLLGVGPGRFGGEVAHRFGTPVDARYGIGFHSSWHTVDDFWLHLLVESGAIGGLLLLWLLWWVFAEAGRRLRAPPEDPWSRALLLATLMMVVAFGIIDLTSMALEANATAALLWLVAGLGLATSRRARTAPDLETRPV